MTYEFHRVLDGFPQAHPLGHEAPEHGQGGLVSVSQLDRAVPAHVSRRPYIQEGLREVIRFQTVTAHHDDEGPIELVLEEVEDKIGILS